MDCFALRIRITVQELAVILVNVLMDLAISHATVSTDTPVLIVR